MQSKVYLIGAGPGDPGLMTVKGLDCIKRADTIIYDYLASEALLAFAKPESKLIYVGKKGFTRHITQEEINRILLDEAGAAESGDEGTARIIVRLKGGDPYVFGRGGEEALALAEHGVDFEVVPGVTSGIAAPACAGIPVTHRGVSASVAFVTGNEDPTKKESDIDWNGIAHGAQTLCFYMGIKNLPLIAERLMEAGRDPMTPVALIRWGTTAKQEELTGTLCDIARKAEEHAFKAPAIIVVGEVVNLRRSIGNAAMLPLKGTSIAVTRSRTQASDMLARLRELGADAVECPTIQINELSDYTQADNAILNLAEGAYDWLVLTSTNGVDRFFRRMEVLNLDARALAGCRIAAIGPATAEDLRSHGITADLVPSQYRGEAVAREMLENGALAGQKVLIARAMEARNVIPDTLREAGLQVDVVPLYETVPSSSVQTESALDKVVSGEIRAITFTSSSTVTNFYSLLEKKLAGREDPQSETARILKDLECYSIGPVTTKTMQGLGMEPKAEAQVYTIPGLIEAIVADRA